MTQHRRAPRSATRQAAAWAMAVGTAGWVLTGCTSAPEPAPPAAAPTSAASSPVSSSPAASPTATGSAMPAVTPTPPTAPPSAKPADVTVEVRIADGRVEPNVQTVKVRAGESVTVRGVSDVAESLHVHGYDKTLDLEPGTSAELTFTADVKGVFEIETHESEKLVAKLNVS